MANPFLESWETPFETPPFGRIRVIHYLPAIRKAIKKAKEEIKAIAENPDPPDFVNTIEALENSGDTVTRISSVLFNLNSAETSKELQRAAQEASTLLTRFFNDITLNRKLFRRIRYIYAKKEILDLGKEQLMLLEKKWRHFLLGGADLKGMARKRYREISEELSVLSLKFEENVLEETNSFELHLTDPGDLAGLPENIIEIAAVTATEKGREGWIFTLHLPSYVPFMQNSEKRELREKMYRAYLSRGFHANEYDNRGNIERIVNLRLEMANMLGFANYADMILGDRMAENRENVEIFLDDLHRLSAPAAARDYENVRKFAEGYGHSSPLERWDWPYYAEKLKKSLYNIDDETLKPYFTLDEAEAAVFDLAALLYGIRFVRTDAIPVYHSEVKTFEVYDSDGSLLGILYTDYHPRQGKNGGAWMTSFRDQKIMAGKDIRPLISIVGNFTKPSPSRPSLLSFSELTTFLHEFGHSLHSLMSRCSFESLSGTNVARDFVELPSQFMENYAYEKDWLDSWAAHYETGEKIPGELIVKIKEAAIYNEGYSCMRQLGFACLDMAWHSVQEPVSQDISGFEKGVSSLNELFPEVGGTNFSASFAHIFGGGYAAGYYGYKWAEVLDADAFRYFTEKGIFNSETAGSFRKNILEKGGSEKPMDLYVRFRGSEPTMDAFLERSGMK
jgi:peptidyl-dipeptidase Dcp